MTSNWTTKTIGEVSVNLDKKRKPVKGPDRKPGPYPYYGASGIVDYIDSYIFDGEHLLVAEDGENLRTQNTPIAFKAKGKFWVNNHAHILTGTDEVLTDYIRFWLLSNPIEGFLSGAVMPKLTQAALNSIPISFPTVQEQRRIVGILTSLEYFSESLLSQNTKLESIAQTIFKSWFVNFDPVHAKAAGREPEGLSAEIAALFPNEFMESEIGLIPKGWVISSLGSLAELVNGFAFKSKDWQQDGNRVVKIGNVTPLLVNLDGCSYVSETTALGLDKFQARAGEILVGMTGYVGEAGLVPIHQGKVFVNQRVCKLVPRNPTWRSAVFAISRIPEFKKFCESNASGSAQANISGGQILSFPVVLPSNSSILEALNRAVEPLIETIVNNSGLIANLSDLRDELLPQLISGKIRIEEAEEALADVMPLTEKQVA